MAEGSEAIGTIRRHWRAEALQFRLEEPPGRGHMSRRAGTGDEFIVPVVRIEILGREASSVPTSSVSILVREYVLTRTDP